MKGYTLNLIFEPSRLVTCNSFDAADFTTDPGTTWYFRTSANAFVLLERYANVRGGSCSNARFVGANTVKVPENTTE